MNSWMTSLLDFATWVGRTSVEASILVGLVLLVQWLFGEHLKARWRYWLWMLVIVRLLMPVVPRSAVSLSNLTQNIHVPAFVSSSVVLLASSHRSTTDFSAVDQAALAGREGRGGSQATASIRLWTLIVPVWLAVAVILAIRMSIGNYRLSSRVCRQRPLTDPAVLNLLEDCKEAMKVHVPINVVESSMVHGPALLGFIRPRLLLPCEMLKALTTDELRQVFFHELAHLKRGDVVVNWLTSLLQVIHWFNPVLWLAFRQIRAECEAACDALVLSTGQGGQNTVYGETIIKLIEFSARPELLPGVVGILENKSEMKRRILMIARHNSNAYGWSALAVILMIILAVTGLTGAQEKDVAIPLQENGGTIAVSTPASAAASVETGKPSGDPLPVQKIVLALNPLSTVPELEAMRAAVSDILQAELSQSDAVTLVDRGQMHKVLDELQLGEQGMLAPESARAIGEMVGARYFCSGSLSRSGDKIMATVRVIDVQTTLTKLSYAFLKSAEDAEEAGKTLSTGIVGLITGFEKDRVIRERAVREKESRSKPIPDRWKRPAVMVIISEMHMRAAAVDPSAATEITKRLINAGFPVIDSEYVQIMKEDEQRARKTFASLHTCSEYAKQKKADVLIYGEAVSEMGAALGEFEGCRGRVEVKAIDNTTERILLADSAYGGATDLAETIAGKKALQQAANRLCDHFLYSLCEIWNSGSGR